MIIHSFDDTTDAIISPEKFYVNEEKLYDMCIITFSNVVMSNIMKSFS